MKKLTKFIGYRRVSTDKQEKSGLGLEAQDRDIARHIESCGGVLVAVYTETESGRNCQRPEMLKALAECRAKRATLVIAKLDRLSRNSAFINNLLEADVPFICCDNPHASPLTIRILAAIAQDEAERIGARTKAAMESINQQIRTRGSYRTRSGRVIKRLGRPDGFGSSVKASRAAAMSAERRRQQSAERLGAAGQRARSLLAEGRTTRAIAQSLNEEGFVTSRGLAFSSMQVSRLLR